MSLQQSELPRYRVLSPVFLEDEILHKEGTELVYTGVPNEEMEPLNEAARKESLAFVTMLDDAARATAAHFNRPFNGRITDRNEAIATSLEDAKKIARNLVLPTSGAGPVPIRPDLMTPAQRRAADSRKQKKVLGTKAAPPPKPQAGTMTPVILGNQRAPQTED